jgi:hypothetical protein
MNCCCSPTVALIARSQQKARLVEGFRFPIRSVWMQFLLPLLLRKLRPDLVHYTNYLAPALRTGPYVVSIHDMSLTRTPEHHTLRKKRADRKPRTACRPRRHDSCLTPSESTSRKDVDRGSRHLPGERVDRDPLCRRRNVPTRRRKRPR